MYRGCWEDKNVNTMFDDTSATTREFEVYLIQNSFVPWYGITLNRCIPACKTLGYRYAALQVYSTVKSSVCFALQFNAWLNAFNSSIVGFQDLPYVMSYILNWSYLKNNQSTEYYHCRPIVFIMHCGIINFSYHNINCQATRCFCGNNYGRYKAMDETQCSGDANTCGGDLKGFCGAADRSAVYDTFLADLSSCSSSKNFN